MSRTPEFWARALGRWFFGTEYRGQRVYLTVDPLSLQLAANACGPSFTTPQEAADDFVASVRDFLCRRDWQWWRAGGSWATQDGPPHALLLAGVQVLAVHYMRNDELNTPNAYWGRLRQLLRDDTGGNYMPRGLKGASHQRLWRDGVQRWAKDHFGIKVPLPPEETTSLKHVKIPLMHGLLRQADLARLPRFFRDVGFRPGEVVDDLTIHDHLGVQEDRLQTWFPHRYPRRVLNPAKARRLPACEQIAEYLRCWDGTAWEDVDQEVLGRLRGPAGQVRLFVQWREHNAEVRLGGLLNRDGQGRWQVIKGINLSHALTGGWLKTDYGNYSPIHGSEPFLLVRDDVEGHYEEARQARLGQRILLLLRTGMAGPWRQELDKHVADQPSRWSDRGLPPGWAVLAAQVRAALNRGQLSACWSPYIRAEGASLRPEGGLRLSRRVWLAGAGPRFRYFGPPPPQVLINGKQERIEDELTPALNLAGDHEVRIPGHHREALLIRVRDTVITRPLIRVPVNPNGWRRQADGWPQELNGSAEGDTVRGPAVLGEWPPWAEEPSLPPPVAAAELPVNQAALAWAVARRRGVLPHPAAKSALEQPSGHPLVRQLQRGVNAPGNVHRR